MFHRAAGVGVGGYIRWIRIFHFNERNLLGIWEIGVLGSRTGERGREGRVVTYDAIKVIIS